MAYVLRPRRRDGDLDLWVQQVSGEASRSGLTDQPADDWLSHVLSPDGSTDRLPLRAGRRRDRSHRRPLAESRGRVRRQGPRASHSPDGRWIAYVVIPASLEPRLVRCPRCLRRRAGEPRPGPA
ncbi:MAG: hypothetical protein MZV70_70280 [Desulfobacterales bacterium]|nr:hypothetical protein [Desulfobacterales bacterium]